MQQESEQENSVVDLLAYRSAKTRDTSTPDEAKARRAIEEIAHHLLMAVRVIKSLYQ